MEKSFVQDTISLEIQAEGTVVNKTVKIIATVEAIVPADREDTAFRADIRSMLDKLIRTQDWAIANVVRHTDGTGAEKMSLTAIARVPEEQNYKLKERAAAVSSRGLNISNIVADNSIPATMIVEKEKELRKDLLNLALAELKTINETLGTTALCDPYRIGKISYETASNVYDNSRNIKSMTASTRAYAVAESSSDEDALGNAQKVSISANVEFTRFARLHHA